MVNPRSLENLKPFPKGKSGNPGGRPAGVSLSSLLRDILEADDHAKARELATAVVQRAIDGDAHATRLVFERLEGKVADIVTSATSVTVANASDWPPGSDLVVDVDDEIARRLIGRNGDYQDDD